MTCKSFKVAGLLTGDDEAAPGHDVDPLRGLPPLQRNARDKPDLANKIFAALATQFDVLRMSAHAGAI
jgi:hypothetical protein